MKHVSAFRIPQLLSSRDVDRNAHDGVSIREAIDNLGAGPGAEGTPIGDGDRGRYRAHMTIHEEDVRPSGMAASGGVSTLTVTVVA